MVNELNAIYGGLRISQSADEADHGLNVSLGKEGGGAGLTELRVTDRSKHFVG